MHHGVEYKVPNTNLIFHGGLDDVWIDKLTGELIVVDYKATSQKDDVGIEADWQISYKRQMEMYQWLLRKNGFRVSNTAYFVYCNGRTDVDIFNNHLEFKVSVISHVGDDSWVENKILEAYECLLSDDIPMIEEVETCDYCQYLKAVNQHILKQKTSV